jgi:hypothetical protein
MPGVGDISISETPGIMDVSFSLRYAQIPMPVVCVATVLISSVLGVLVIVLHAALMRRWFFFFSCWSCLSYVVNEGLVVRANEACCWEEERQDLSNLALARAAYRCALAEYLASSADITKQMRYCIRRLRSSQEEKDTHR